MGAVTADKVESWYIAQGGIDVQEAQEHVKEAPKTVVIDGETYIINSGHYESRQIITVSQSRFVVAPSSFTASSGARSSFSFKTGPKSAISFAHAGRSGMGSYRCVRNTLNPIDLICGLHEEVEVWQTESTPRIIAKSKYETIAKES